jgi:hypothetical protein
MLDISHNKVDAATVLLPALQRRLRETLRELDISHTRGMDRCSQRRCCSCFASSG